MAGTKPDSVLVFHNQGCWPGIFLLTSSIFSCRPSRGRCHVSISSHLSRLLPSSRSLPSGSSRCLTPTVKLVYCLFLRLAVTCKCFLSDVSKVFYCVHCAPQSRVHSRPQEHRSESA
jgi:hypothetical protein